MIEQQHNRKYSVTGALLEAIRKNISWLSKMPLFMAIPITILLALGVSISPVIYAILLMVLPLIVFGVALIAVVNFLIGLKNTMARCEHNLISHLEDDIRKKQQLLSSLIMDVKRLVNNPYIAPEKITKLNSIINYLESEEKPKVTAAPSIFKRMIQKIPSLIDIFFKYFVIVPGCIGAFGGVLFLIGMASGINLFQMGTLVMFASLTGVGGLIGFGIVISICLIAMIALFIYKAKFEEKIANQHKQIHDKETSLLIENEKLDKQLWDWVDIKSKLAKLDSEEYKLIGPHFDVIDQHHHAGNFYSKKKSKAYIISGAVFSGINEAVFMFAKYVTFSGLCVVVLTSMGMAITPVFFIGLTAALCLFTMVMAGIGVFKYLNSVKAVNSLSEDRVLKYLRGKVKSQNNPSLNYPNEPYLKDLQKYREFISKLDQRSGLVGIIIKKLAVKKAIEKVIDLFPFIKQHFRAVESIFRYCYIFAISLAALTSLTILIAGIAGKTIIGLGAILSVSMLFGVATPAAFIAVIAVAIIIGLAVSYYKKNYENPLAKAQRDAANEKTHLVRLLEKDNTPSVTTAPQPTAVKSPVRHKASQVEHKPQESTNLLEPQVLAL